MCPYDHSNHGQEHVLSSRTSIDLTVKLPHVHRQTSAQKLNGRELLTITPLHVRELVAVCPRSDHCTFVN